MKNSKADKSLACAISFTIVVCIMILMFTLSFGASGAGTNTLTTVCELNLRSSASTSSSVLVTMPSSASVTLLENSTNGWAKIKYSSYTGYCVTDYLNAPSGSLVSMTGKTTSEVNLRSGKGTSYSVLTVVPKSATVSVVNNTDEGWVKVSYSSYSGYIKRDYLTVIFTIAETSETQSTITPTKPTTNSDFTYKNPDFSVVPHWYEYSYTDTLLGEGGGSIPQLYLSKTEIALDINGKSKLTAFISSGFTVMEQVSFKSDNEAVAGVSQKGIVTAKSSGVAVITATDKVSGCVAKCTVYVGKNVLPTEPETTKPTEVPTTPKPTTPKPTTEIPTQKPTTLTETLTLSESEVKLYVGTQHIIKATSNTDVTWSSSDSTVASVSGGVITVNKAGTATITAKTSTKKATCTITAVDQKTTIHSSHTSATITAGKTFLARSNTSGVTWSSSDESIATVDNGYIFGVKKGQAIIKIYKKGGTKTILVNVTSPAPIRFAYTSPNCAPKNSEVTLVAITDSKRTDVRFNIKVGDKTETVYADSKTKDGNNYIWKGKTTFSSAGTYSVTAYSEYKSKWTTCDDAKTTAFVTATTNRNTTSCEQRRASDEIIDLIALYEGFLGEVYDDPLTGDPTLGYGRVVYSGQQFYNNLTKNEAYAYLVQTVNNDGYANKVNQFLIDNNVKFNQQQFDALVCFVYNTGTGVLSNDDELRAALLKCDSGSSSSTKTYYINGSNVRIRKGPGTSYDIIDELAYGTTLKILDKSDSAWFYVELTNGTKGYVSSDYISSRVSSGSLDLNFVDKQNLINKFCQYHHANGCVYGLLYRRVDEMEVFFYNDYERNYAVYNYPIKFTCASNPSFHT